eukprot:2970473-Prymnesium_polylepis.3
MRSKVTDDDAPSEVSAASKALRSEVSKAVGGIVTCSSPTKALLDCVGQTHFSSEGVGHSARGVAGIKSDEYAIVLIRDRELAVAPRPEDLGTPALPFEVLVDERADCGTWPRTALSSKSWPKRASATSLVTRPNPRKGSVVVAYSRGRRTCPAATRRAPIMLRVPYPYLRSSHAMFSFGTSRSASAAGAAGTLRGGGGTQDRAAHSTIAA